MAIKMSERKCYVSSYHCDDCKPYLDNECKWIGNKLIDEQMYYVHICNLCNKKYNLVEIYPAIQMIEEEPKSSILLQ